MADQLSFDFEPAVNPDDGQRAKHADYMRDWSRKNPDKVRSWRQRRRASHPEMVRSQDNASKKRQKARDPESFNKKAAAKQAKWRKDNPDKNRAAKRRAYHSHRIREPDASRAKYRKLAQAQRKTPQGRIRGRLRSRMHSAMNGRKRAGSAVRDLGCTIEDFRVYIEAMFTPGMTWENYGFRGWHLDHIQPLARFDLTDPEQFLKAAHHTNYQPLWAADNMRKGATFITQE